MFCQLLSRKKITALSLLLLPLIPVIAQDAGATKSATSGYNLLAILLIITTILLSFVIWGLGQVLIALSKQLLAKTKAFNNAAASLVLILVLFSSNLMAQNADVSQPIAAAANYGGLSATTFYFLVTVVVTEVAAILFLFFSIKRIYVELVPEKRVAAIQSTRMADLWTRLDKKFFTKAIPVEQEADALLDHDYDGIQELDNSLPPWWKYGFVLTIGFALVYLLNFHVLGNGKNPTEEYNHEMEIARIEKEIFDANNKDKIDEANVPMASEAGIKNGKEYYMANCVACHGTLGEGGAGPNLTDDYWLHKGSLNDIYKTLKIGYADKGMQSWANKFSPKEMSEIASFVKTLKGTEPPNAKAKQGDLYVETTTGGITIKDATSSTIVLDTIPNKR